jgi:hypothetical protein
VGDFDAVVFADDLPMTIPMIGLIAESRYAADIAYYLGRHRDEAAAIAQKPLPEAGRAILAIEAQVKAAEK